MMIPILCLFLYINCRGVQPQQPNNEDSSTSPPPSISRFTVINPTPTIYGPQIRIHIHTPPLRTTKMRFGFQGEKEPDWIPFQERTTIEAPRSGLLTLIGQFQTTEGQTTEIEKQTLFVNLDKTEELFFLEHTLELSENHGCRINTDFKVLCWGQNQYGECGVSPTEHTKVRPTVIEPLSNIIEVTVGNGFSAALNDKGEVWVWGSNFTGALGNGSEATSHSHVPQKIEGLPKITKLVAGYEHLCVLSENREVFCWGQNQTGQVGISPSLKTRVNLPEKVSIDGLILDLFAGSSNTCILNDQQKVRCWGDNRQQQIQDSKREFYSSPVTLPNQPADIMDVAIAQNTIAFLTAKGQIFTVGSNEYGQGGTGTTYPPLYTTPHLIQGLAEKAISIQAGLFHFCAFLVSKNLFCWGSNRSLLDKSQEKNSILRGQTLTFNLPGQTEAMVLGPLSQCLIRKNTPAFVRCWGLNRHELITPSQSEVIQEPIEWVENNPTGS